MQHQADLDWFLALEKTVRKGFKSGLPLHIADPINSVFHIIDQQTYDGLLPREVQALWKMKHVVRTGLPKAHYGFDQTGLATLTYPERVFTIHGMLTYIKTLVVFAHLLI
jgi:hypothetical protein